MGSPRLFWVLSWFFLVVIRAAADANEVKQHAEVQYKQYVGEFEPAGTTYLLQAVKRNLNAPTLAGAAAASAQRQQQSRVGGPDGSDSEFDDERLFMAPDNFRRQGVPVKASGSLAAQPSKGARAQLFEPVIEPAEINEAMRHHEEHHHHSPHGEGWAPRVAQSYNGLNSFDTRFANSGNQLFVVPASPSLGVGHGFVLEIVNTVLRVYDEASGAPLTPVLDINTFFGLPAQANRTARVIGPRLKDSRVWYDSETDRWFVVAVTLESTPDIIGQLTGSNYIDIAVSKSNDPTGSWSYYRINGMNDGNNGTPDAGCTGGSCLQSNPSIATWDNALIITSEQTGFSPGGAALPYSAVVYAVDKRALVTGAAQANTALVLQPSPNPESLQFLVPAQQVGRCSLRNTFLMATTSTALFNPAPTDLPKSLKLLTLVGTQTLRDAAPTVELLWVSKDVFLDFEYSSPPPASQKPGVNPHGLAPQGPPAFGFNTSSIQKIDAGLGLLGSLAFVDDKLYATWGTALPDDPAVAGVAWAVVDPEYPLKSKADGVLGLPGGNSLLYPSWAVRPDGLGVLAVSVAGPDFWPSVAYAVSHDGLGPRAQALHVVAMGAGVTDESAGYATLGLINPFGQFSTALVNEFGRFWFANQYVAQTCSLSEYLAGAPLYTCGDTRTQRTNWATRITEVQLVD